MEKQPQLCVQTQQRDSEWREQRQSGDDDGEGEEEKGSLSERVELNDRKLWP